MLCYVMLMPIPCPTSIGQIMMNLQAVDMEFAFSAVCTRQVRFCPYELQLVLIDLSSEGQ